MYIVHVSVCCHYMYTRCSRIRQTSPQTLPLNEIDVSSLILAHSLYYVRTFFAPPNILSFCDHTSTEEGRGKGGNPHGWFTPPSWRRVRAIFQHFEHGAPCSKCWKIAWTRRHSQNRKYTYTTFRIAVNEGPRYGQRQHVQKILCASWDMRANKQIDRHTDAPMPWGKVNIGVRGTQYFGGCLQTDEGRRGPLWCRWEVGQVEMPLHILQ